jgi:hypothetical protein
MVYFNNIYLIIIVIFLKICNFSEDKFVMFDEGMRNAGEKLCQMLRETKKRRGERLR